MVSKVAPASAYAIRGGAGHAYFWSRPKCAASRRAKPLASNASAPLWACSPLPPRFAVTSRRWKPMPCACSQIDDYLHQIDVEAATYSELARASQRSARRA